MVRQNVCPDMNLNCSVPERIFWKKIGTLIVATIVLLEINGGPEHRYSSRLPGSLLSPYLTRWVQDLSVASKLFVLENKYSLCTICSPTYS